MPKEILTAQEAADLLGYTKTYLYELARTGKVPGHKGPSGRKWFFLRNKLIEWVNQDCPSKQAMPSLFD